MQNNSARDDERPAGMSSRADLTAYLAELAATVGAEHYMLLAVVHDRDRSDASIIASNWVYDAIHLVGFRQLAAIATCEMSTLPGADCNCLSLGAGMPADEASVRLLEVLGHAEIVPLRLFVGRQRYYLLLSASGPGMIDAAAVATSQLAICYALSRAPDLLASASLVDPLTDRERECLFWVSEGKTTDDIAIILGVSANTTNSYITNSIQKLGANNRSMAMATAIRSGVI